MKIKTLICITFFSMLDSFTCSAGSRPGEFSLVNVSKQPMNKEGKRLFELIQKDLMMLYNDSKYEFAWEANGTKIKTLDPSTFAGCFEPKITIKDKKKFSSIMSKLKSSDGLIIFEYDLKGRQVRFKHFSYHAKENILIRLPINNGGAMNLSLWKDSRRAALVALGQSFDFSP